MCAFDIREPRSPKLRLEFELAMLDREAEVQEGEREGVSRSGELDDRDIARGRMDWLRR